MVTLYVELYDDGQPLDAETRLRVRDDLTNRGFLCHELSSVPETASRKAGDNTHRPMGIDSSDVMLMIETVGPLVVNVLAAYLSERRRKLRLTCKDGIQVRTIVLEDVSEAEAERDLNSFLLRSPDIPDDPPSPVD